MIRKMIRLAIASVMAVVPTVVMAKGECKEDRTKFCKEVVEAKGDVGACLKKHSNELSEACKTKKAGGGDAKTAAPEAAAPGAPEGAATEGAAQ
jgi:Cysteine rich repeat